jgi:hypothetical protein
MDIESLAVAKRLSLVARGVAFVLFCFADYAAAQQSVATQQQAILTLQNAYAALVGHSTLSDVSLTGTARRIAGSDDETGSVIFKALAATGSRTDLNLPSGTRSEIRNIASAIPTGSWSGPDGVAHSVSYHNVVTYADLFPAFTLSRFAISKSAIIIYIGTETKNDISVTHLTAFEQPVGLTGAGATLAQHLSQIEIFLDVATFVPVAIDFNIHPDDNAGLDIPVEIRFSDYRNVSGTLIPFHVQKYLNNGLILDFQFNNAVVNSGVTANTFMIAM